MARRRGGILVRLLWFVFLFLVFFLGRLGYGYYTTPDKIVKRSARSRVPEITSEVTSSKKNYASERSATRPSVQDAMRQAGQKYEKTATVVTGTRDYDKDEQKLRATVKEYGATIQFEHNVGRSDVKTRAMRLMIGVQPDSFDKFYAAVRLIGRPDTAEVTKVDRTNEYLDLRAQRESLEDTRDALLELKRSMGGSMDELVNLQFRILDVDKQLQELGVKLGDYDEVNEFCTVRVTLYEDYDVLVYPPTQARRVMIAFKWALKYYAAALVAMACFSIFAFFLVAIMDRARAWSDPPGRHELRSEPEKAEVEEKKEESKEEKKEEA